MQSRVMNGRPYVRTYLPAEISQARQREREDAGGAWGLVLKVDEGSGHGVEGRRSRGEVVLKREGGGSDKGTHIGRMKRSAAVVFLDARDQEKS